MATTTNTTSDPSKQTDLYSKLYSGTDPQTQQVYDTIGSQVSGSAYEPYMQSANEALARSAASLRAQTGSQFAPDLGQGAATAAQQRTENTILGNTSQTLLQEEQGKQAMENQGIQNANALGQLALSNEQEQTAQGYLGIAQQQENSANYWDTQKMLSTYATTHPNSNANDPAYQAIVGKAYTAQTGKAADPNDPAFQQYAQQQWAAATNPNLTNPINVMYNTIANSSADPATKAMMQQAFTNELAGGTVTTDASGNKQVTYADGSIVSVDPSTGKLTQTAPFAPNVTVDMSNTTAPYGFSASGNVWVSSTGLTGKNVTQPIGQGDQILLKTAASIQGSSSTIPAGNYTAVDTTHIQNMKTGVIYDTTGKSSPQQGQGKGQPGTAETMFEDMGSLGLASDVSAISSNGNWAPLVGDILSGGVASSTGDLYKYLFGS
jgi:hypothetical protein